MIMDNFSSLSCSLDRLNCISLTAEAHGLDHRRKTTLEYKV